MNNTFYQTGQTTPRKSHQGLIAILLILVILLCGLVTVLGMMNVRLFRMLEQQTSVRFSQNQTATPADAGVYAPALGINAQEISAIYRSYNDWPEGVYISIVDAHGPAATAQLRPGDILLTLNGVSITDEAALITASNQLMAGQQYPVTVFRDNTSLTLTVTAAAQ